MRYALLVAVAVFLGGCTHNSPSPTPKAPGTPELVRNMADAAARATVAVQNERKTIESMTPANLDATKPVALTQNAEAQTDLSAVAKVAPAAVASAQAELQANDDLRKELAAAKDRNSLHAQFTRWATFAIAGGIALVILSYVLASYVGAFATVIRSLGFGLVAFGVVLLGFLLVFAVLQWAVVVAAGCAAAYCIAEFIYRRFWLKKSVSDSISGAFDVSTALPVSVPTVPKPAAPAS